MRNLLKLALLIAAISTTAACTEDPDAVTADVLEADEPNDLVVDGELEPADVESTRTGAVDHEEVTPDEMRRTARSRLDWLRRARLTK